MQIQSCESKFGVGNLRVLKFGMGILLSEKNWKKPLPKTSTIGKNDVLTTKSTFGTFSKKKQDWEPKFRDVNQNSKMENLDARNWDVNQNSEMENLDSRNSESEFL